MDYLGIIKKAYHITIKHKFLWIFGILAGGFGGFQGFSSNFNYNANSSDLTKFTSKLPYSSFAAFWEAWGTLVIVLGVIFAILGIILFILNIASQGALIGSVDDLDKGKKSNFSEGLKIGFRNFWRVLGVMVLFGLMILASTVVWLGPAVLLAVFGQWVLAFIWGILLLFVALSFWILVGIILPYALRVVVLEGERVWEASRSGLHFFRDYWKETAVMYLLLIAVSLGFGIAFILGILICGGILAAIGFGVWLASPAVAVGYGIVVGLAFLGSLITISGAYGAFQSTAITLTYKELKKS